MSMFIYKKPVLPDAGKFISKLVTLKEIPNQFYNATKDKEDRKSQLEWEFAYEEHPEMQIRLWSSRSLSTYRGKKSKALTLIEALLGKELTDKEKGDFTDIDSLIGKTCSLTVTHVKNDEGQVFAKITGFEKLSEAESA